LGRRYVGLPTVVTAIPRNGQRSLAASALLIDAVEIKGRKTRRVYFWCKRSIDVILASLLLVVLFPLMLAIAVLIKLESPGPVLFVQQRVGIRRQIKGGRLVWLVHTFSFYTFRSMIRNADQSLHEA
jgi:lipopolysaccharide/colanic/teichoic acid biosynthesis glycosyltransferase